MKSIISGIFLFILVIAGACRKSTFLAVKPDDDLVIPGTLDELQALMDNASIMNGFQAGGLTPGIGESSADDYVLRSDEVYDQSTEFYRKIYTWDKQIYSGIQFEDESWAKSYRVVFYSNIVLEGLSKIAVDPSNQSKYNNLKGQALFSRAFCLWQLAQIYCAVYDKNSADQQWGLPLPMTSSVNEKLVRATVQKTYDRIIQDLNSAADLCSAESKYVTRGSGKAAYAMLARTYLSMGDYGNALQNADKALQINSSLLDYNDIPAPPFFTRTFTYASLNKEVVFSVKMTAYNLESMGLVPTVYDIDKGLFDSYTAYDLRATRYFQFINYGFNVNVFLGSYLGFTDAGLFSGLANDEMYLTRAECYARLGNLDAAKSDLNALLIKRYATGMYTNETSTDRSDLLRKILLERRKELVFRGLRWTDLRRLNKEPEFAVTLHRTVKGQEYTLPPNDPRYTQQIPFSVISFNKDMPQNIR